MNKQFVNEDFILYAELFNRDSADKQCYLRKRNAADIMYVGCVADINLCS